MNQFVSTVHETFNGEPVYFVARSLESIPHHLRAKFQPKATDPIPWKNISEILESIKLRNFAHGVKRGKTPVNYRLAKTYY